MLTYLTLTVLPLVPQPKGGARGERGVRLLNADDAIGWIYLFICLYLCGLALPLKPGSF